MGDNHVRSILEAWNGTNLSAFVGIIDAREE